MDAHLPCNEIRNKLRSSTLTIKNDVVRRFKPETLCTKTHIQTWTIIEYYASPWKVILFAPMFVTFKKGDEGYDWEEHIIWCIPTTTNFTSIDIRVNKLEALKIFSFHRWPFLQAIFWGLQFRFGNSRLGRARGEFDVQLKGSWKLGIGYHEV